MSYDIGKTGHAELRNCVAQHLKDVSHNWKNVSHNTGKTMPLIPPELWPELKLKSPKDCEEQFVDEEGKAEVDANWRVSEGAANRCL